MSQGATESLKNLSMNEKTEEMQTETIPINSDDGDELLHSDSGNSSNKSERRKLTKFDIRHNEMMRSLNSMHAKHDEFRLFTATATNKFVEIDEKLNENDARVSALESKIKAMESSTMDRFDWMAQEKLKTDISIIGIPTTENENRKQIVVEICSFFGVKVNAADIESAHRMKLKRSNMMIVRFRNYDSKLQLMAAKVKKNATLGDIRSIHSGSKQTKNIIYINHHVSPKTGRMQQLLRYAVREQLIESQWISPKGMGFRFKADAEPTIVTNIDQIKNILGEDIEEKMNNIRSQPIKRRLTNDSPSPNAVKQVSKMQRNKRDGQPAKSTKTE